MPAQTALQASEATLEDAARQVLVKLLLDKPRQSPSLLGPRSESPPVLRKHVLEGMPKEIRPIRLQDRDSGPRIYISGIRGLLALVQLGVVEIHPSGSRTDRIDRPDRLVFDLDPGVGVAWERVVEAATSVRGILEECGLEGFPRTTGGKGLHVVVPIQRTLDWHEARQFCRRVARLMEADEPSKYTSRQSKALRADRIYVDWLRNSRGQPPSQATSFEHDQAHQWPRRLLGGSSTTSARIVSM